MRAVGTHHGTTTHETDATDGSQLPAELRKP